MSKGGNIELEVIDGKIPVLLSAPHVFSHKRPRLCGLYKQGEFWTDYLVRNICAISGAYGIVSINELDYDPNYYPVEKNEYKKKIKELVKKKKIKYIIDIHGLSDEHTYDFGIYYVNLYNRSKNLGYQLAESLNRGALRHSLIQMLNFRKDDQETISEFATKKLKLVALQIEIARYLRENDKLREAIVKNISEFIATL